MVAGLWITSRDAARRLLPGIPTASAFVISGRFSSDRKWPLLGDPQGMQELMRHSTLRTTMDVYTQAVAPAKHAAQAAVLALFFPITISVDEEAIVGTA